MLFSFRLDRYRIAPTQSRKWFTWGRLVVLIVNWTSHLRPNKKPHIWHCWCFSFSLPAENTNDYTTHSNIHMQTPLDTFHNLSKKTHLHTHIDTDAHTHTHTHTLKLLELHKETLKTREGLCIKNSTKFWYKSFIHRILFCSHFIIDVLFSFRQISNSFYK